MWCESGNFIFTEFSPWLPVSLPLPSSCLTFTLISANNILFLTLILAAILLALVNQQSFVRIRRPKFRSTVIKAAVISFIPAVTSSLITIFNSDSQLEDYLWRRPLSYLFGLFGQSLSWIVVAITLWTDFRVSPWCNLLFQSASIFLMSVEVMLYVLIPKENEYYSDQDMWMGLTCRIVLIIASMFAFNKVRRLVGSNIEVYMDSRFSLPMLSESDDLLGRETLESKAGIINQLFFWWSLPTIYTGFRTKTLDYTDLVPLALTNHPRIAFSKFERILKTHKGYHLFYLLYECNKDSFWICGAVLFLSTCVGFLSPVVLQKLLEYVQNTNNRPLDGYILAGILFLSKLVQSVLEHQFWIQGIRCGMRCQSALMTKVYQKALRLSSISSRKYSVGEIVNLMTVDACRISESSFIPFFHWGSWCAILILVISISALYNILGASMLCGWLIIASFWPVSIALARKVKQFSKESQNIRDERARLIGSVLSMIRVIKSLRWEDFVVKTIGTKRDAEISAQGWRLLFGGLIDIWNSITQIAAPIATFFLYSRLQNQPLTAVVAFSSLSWFSVLTKALGMVPLAIVSLMDVLASFERLEKFFNAHEFSDVSQESSDLSISPLSYEASVAGYVVEKKENFPIVIQHGSFSWDAVLCQSSDDLTDSLLLSKHEDTNSALRDINISIDEGSLTFVIGPIGSGKSSLLASLMGECFLIEGSLQVEGKKAYVGHIPWMQNMSIRDNILFGKDYHSDRYRQVLECCSLIQDLNEMSDGDNTEVGDDGSNLSGGQKQRLNLARAIYSDASIFLLDDVLSALDAHVATHVFEECVVKFLNGKTRIVVTHQVKYLNRKEINRIVVMSPDGSIYAIGSYLELKLRDDEYINKCLHGGAHNYKENVCSDHIEEKHQHSDRETIEDKELIIKEFQNEVVLKEGKFDGSIKKEFLVRYLNFFGSCVFVAFVTFVFAGEQVLTVLNNWWLSQTVSSDSSSVKKKLYVYSGLGLATCMFTLLRIGLVILGGINSAKRIHQSMLNSILHAPLEFFDTKLTGRILNRFVADQYNIDSAIPSALSNVTSKFLYLGSSLVVLGYVFPYLLIIVFILGIPYHFLSEFYRWSARDIRRLEAMSKSPLNVHMVDTLKGITTIRSLGAEKRFLDRQIDISEQYLCCFWNRWCTNQWVTVWLEFLGTLFTLSFGVLSVWASNSHLNISSGVVGLMLSYAVQVPSDLGWLLKLFVQAEVEFVSLERVIEYVDVLPEIQEGKLPDDDNWPQSGMIQIEDLKLQYSPQMPYVLKGMSTNINNGEKVAIIGRTAAGKSSLLSALLRFYPYEGTIQVDGENLESLALSKTRSAIGLIAQSPALFGDTLKEVLCGPQTHLISDTTVWSVLDEVKMGDFARLLRNGLESSLNEVGLSAGQKQLLCLARAILNPTPILLCDEVTANVDVATDDAIHSLLLNRENTILFICHRLYHIQKFDFVLVMENGKVQESGNPSVLLKDTTSILYQMYSVGNGTRKQTNNLHLR